MKKARHTVVPRLLWEDPPLAPAAPRGIPAAADSTLRLRSRFIDVERSSVHVFAVESADSSVSFRVHAHLDESEASGLPGVAVRHDVHAIDGAV